MRSSSSASLKLSAVRCKLFRASSCTAIAGAVLRARPCLMRDVVSQPKSYECCSGYVCLLQDCALKGVSEAIAEGMGGCMGSLHGARTPCLLRGWRQRGGGLLDCASALR